jgi:hypothetical protein
MAHQHDVLQIKGFDQLGEIVGVGVHVITLPRLTGPPMTPAVSSNAAVALVDQKKHLIFKGIRVEAIRMIKNDGFPFPQSLK